MAFQSLYRRYRPKRFGEVRGQEHVVRALRNATRDERVAHAYLFSGPRGTGKTSTARILAMALNCEAPDQGEPDGTCAPCRAIQGGSSLDVVELDAASNRRIDDVRELLRGVSLATGGRTKVYILDEVHMLTNEASAALLKTLEEPPAHVVFVLATTDPQKVLPTIRSRTQHFDFHLLPAATLSDHLRWVVDDAGLAVSEEAVQVAVRRGQGSARDALSALDQIAAAGGEAEDDAFVDDLVEALCERDTGRALVGVAAAISAGRDPRNLAEGLLAGLRDAFLSVLAPASVSLPDAALERVGDQGRRLGPAASVRALDAVGEALLAMREAPDPRTALEVALVRVTRPETDTAPAALLERIERLEKALRSGVVGPPRAASNAAAPDAGAGAEAVTPPPSTSPARQAARSAVEASDTSSVPAPPRPALGGVRRRTPPAEPPPQVEAHDSATTPPSTASVDLPTRDELTLAWADRVLVTLRPKAKGLFSAGRFTEVQDGQAVFALPTEALRVRAELSKGEVEAALAAVMGHAVPLRLVVDTSAEVPASVLGREAPTLVAGEPEESVDLDALVDAPAQAQTGIGRLADAFPGAEVVDDAAGPRR